MDNPFTVLKDQQLGSVIFVQDYLQLDFDGHIITYYEWPVIAFFDKEFGIDDKEYRDRLCSLIAKEVMDVTFIENQNLVINFKSGEQIKSNIKDAKGEIVYFTTPKGKWSSI